MFRVKRKETKWKRLNTIAKLLTPPHNVGDKSKVMALIIDYLYDFYDGLERVNFPHAKQDLLIIGNPWIFSAIHSVDQSYRPYGISISLSKDFPLDNIFVEANFDGSFLTKANGIWETTPGLTDV